MSDSKSGEGSEAILISAWQQALSIHTKLHLPVAQLLFLLPPPPSSSSSSLSNDGNEVLSFEACKSVLRDPWYVSTHCVNIYVYMLLFYILLCFI